MFIGLFLIEPSIEFDSNISILYYNNRILYILPKLILISKTGVLTMASTISRKISEFADSNYRLFALFSSVLLTLSLWCLHKQDESINSIKTIISELL